MNQWQWSDEHHERFARNDIEKNYQVEKRIALCDGMELTATESELKEFRSLWRSGYPLEEIAEKLERSEFEALFMAIDQLDKGLAQEREGGIFGQTNGHYHLSRRANDFTLIRDPRTPIETVREIWQEKRNEVH